jgi:hypothetical protein
MGKITTICKQCGRKNTGEDGGGITKHEFMHIVGEDPEDVLGPDWEYSVQEFLENNNYE